MKHLIFATLFFLSAHANSADKEAIQLSVADGNLSAQVKAIEIEIMEKDYQEMEYNDRATLLNQLASIESGEVTGGTITTYENNVNSILKKAFADSKLICEQMKPTGSKRAIRTCTTVAAKNRLHKDVQQSRNTGVGPAASTAIQ
ncbi:MAG TPA: hypothetical protein VN247_01805 [Arenimonas sp.]|nr:hypothetical protein [Arenimonas sp.]